jgi:hypothetical protein
VHLKGKASADPHTAVFALSRLSASLDVNSLVLGLYRGISFWSTSRVALVALGASLDLNGLCNIDSSAMVSILHYLH